MLPSRGQIQVTLDDTGTRRVQCKPPPVQVKILRRPKPLSDEDSFKKSTHQVSSANKDSINVFEERLLTDGSSKQRQEDGANPDTFAARTKASLGGIKNIGQRSKDNCPLETTHSRGYTTITSRDASSSLPFNATQSSTRSFDAQQSNQSSNSSDQSSKRQVLKTYQERASEYAKARLRILGSTFPEYDDPTTDNDAGGNWNRSEIVGYNNKF